MQNSKIININIDIQNMEIGSFAAGINTISDLQAKVQGLLF